MSHPVLPELVRIRAERSLSAYCAERSDRLNCPHVILEFTWERDGVQLSCRDGCNPPHPLALFRYVDDLHQWFLFAPDDGGWRPCLEVHPALDIERLLRHLDADPLKMFWPPAFTCFS